MGFYYCKKAQKGKAPDKVVGVGGGGGGGGGGEYPHIFLITP